MRNQNWWMVAACLVPLLLIFLAPTVGFQGSNSVFLAVVVMFLCHFMMMGSGHKHDEEHDQDNKGTKKGEHHGCH